MIRHDSKIKISEKLPAKTGRLEVLARKMVGDEVLREVLTSDLEGVN
jgi:hypothetical protein